MRERREQTPKPPCRNCGWEYSDVKDSGVEYVTCAFDPTAYIRQRKCQRCGHLWLTYEINPPHTISGSDKTA
jgi:transcriptional regulator NrdR family protein